MSKNRQMLCNEDYGKRKDQNGAIKNSYIVRKIHFIGNGPSVHCETALCVPNPQKAVLTCRFNGRGNTYA